MNSQFHLYSCYDCGYIFDVFPMELIQCPKCNWTPSKSGVTPEQAKYRTSVDVESKIAYDAVMNAIIPDLKCECGAHSVGVDKHSDWCALSKGTIEDFIKTVGDTSPRTSLIQVTKGKL